MIQQGQVFKLKTKGADGQPLWSHRYRLAGRGSERPLRGPRTSDRQGRTSHMPQYGSPAAVAMLGAPGRAGVRTTRA
jgi:hypothetical protein